MRTEKLVTVEFIDRMGRRLEDIVDHEMLVAEADPTDVVDMKINLGLGFILHGLEMLDSQTREKMNDSIDDLAMRIGRNLKSGLDCENNW